MVREIWRETGRIKAGKNFKVSELKLVDRKLVKAPSDFIAGRPKAALLFWFFMVVLIYLVCKHCGHLYSCPLCSLSCFIIKNKKISKNRCLVFLDDLVLFCSVILSL